MKMRIRNIGMTFVKCTRFLDVQTAGVEKHGIAGDREFLLLDEKGAPLAPYHHRHFLPLKFRFDLSSERLTLEYPDGRIVEGAGAMVGPTIALDYMGMRQVDVRAVAGDWDAVLSEFSGRSVRMVRSANPGGGIDVLPITLVTTGSLSKLTEKLGAPVDHRRFRANLVIESHDPFVEDSWEGRYLRTGSAVLRVRSSVPRCVVTQYDPDRGTDDLAVVPGLGKFRNRVGLPDGLMPTYATPGFASYAEVVEPGALAVGDAVELA